MDSEVTEIPRPVFRTRNKNRHKPVVVYEVIDVNSDDESADVIDVDKQVESKNKGKAVECESYGSGSSQPKGSSKSPVSGLHNVINLDSDFDDNFMDEDCALLQAYFDSVDIPAGVEAPVPWLSDPAFRKKKTVNGFSSSYKDPTSVSGSTLLNPVGVPGHSTTADITSSGLSPQSSLGKAGLPGSRSSQDLPYNVMTFTPPHPRQYPLTKQYMFNQDPFFLPMTPGPGLFGTSNIHGQVDTSDLDGHVGSSTLFYPGAPNYPPAVQPFMSWWSNSLNPEVGSNFVSYETYPSFYDTPDVYNPPAESRDIPSPPGQDSTKIKLCVDVDDILKKFKTFKQFDTVEGYSDNHYASMSSSMKQPSKNWVKRIQEEWKMLEKDLPDTIFVRAYESRMDILRAVIVGAEGTPYHDGLFFFDVFFPSGYPSVPPLVYYHSGGLRLNPNLYACGKVCLSLLNTWSGQKNEKWIPSMSTMLQVLVSIQALILNEKPYFNEPGWACMKGTVNGENESRKYNESTYLLSLKTMIYTMRRPPEHFQDFVVGHFHQNAHNILIASKAYMDGAQVGSHVKGGPQLIEKGNRSCPKHFKDSLAANIDLLVKEFSKIGVKDCENFLTQTSRGVPVVGNHLPKAKASI
ncbi:probable ubiquitin-conjugating enzyme E2 25 [Mangifera indica]|uniref:probable ubiquitin-conjugating enzyme E2 25 n=1 Tax=Mangifera indica TaxID=29780 RepID=UPI001CFA23E2|nr:probable ubiquitin-conjugating enzyme E2 25 [Mangifera indica]